MITPALLAAKGVRVISRPFGHVVLTRVLGANDEDFNRAAVAWLATAEGAAWLARERQEGRS